MDGKTEAAVAVRREYDCTEQAPSVAALNALADIKNVRAVDLTETMGSTLQDHVDADALDRLLRTDPEATVSFEFDRYEVRIDGQELVITLD